MENRTWLVGAVCAATLCFVAACGQPSSENKQSKAEKGGASVSGPYEVVTDWPKPFFSEDMTWGRTSSVFAQSPDRVFLLMSGLVPVSWRELKGEIKEGVRQGGPGWGNPRRVSSDAAHCASSRSILAMWKGTKLENRPWACQTDADGNIIDSLVRDATGEPIPGSRWDHIVTVYNRNGELIESWEQWNHLFSHPHFVMISPYDPEKHVWIVDTGADQIFKFTNDGKNLVMTIGEAHVAGHDENHLATPTMLAFLPNGDFYVSDGYSDGGGGTRVVKFSKDGKYLMEWGKPGTGPGEFNTLHSIAIDASGRVYIADRTNRRIQVFDANGRFLDQWPNIPFPNHIAITNTKDQHLWVADGYVDKLIQFDLNGKLLSAFGTYGDAPGYLRGTHYFHTDSEGNLYTADVFGGRVQKFRPREGADPKQLIGAVTSPGSTGLYGKP